MNGTVQGSDFFRRSSLWTEGPSPILGGLEAVGEEDHADEDSEDDNQGEEEELDVDQVLLESQGTGSVNSGAVQTTDKRKPRRKQRDMKKSGGGGLDLAAELEAAQWADEEQRLEESEKPKKKKKHQKKDEGWSFHFNRLQSLEELISPLHSQIYNLRYDNFVTLTKLLLSMVRFFLVPTCGVETS